MDTFCSGEIIGYKIQVPCFPEKYLLNSYGKNWWNPDSINYTYENVDYKLERLTEFEWFNSYRYYFKNGQIDYSGTYSLIIRNSLSTQLFLGLLLVILVYCLLIVIRHLNFIFSSSL